MLVYLAYGLRVRSAIPLVGLPSVPHPDVEADVTIEVGAVLDRATNAPRTGSFEARPGHIFLWHPRTGAVLAHAGRQLVVEPAANVDDGLLQSILLGQGFAALFLQRGMPTLHASAVTVGEGVVAFVGQKGDGKSTTAAALVAAGHPLVTDDLLVTTVSEEGRPTVVPGYGFLKLSPESAAAVGVAPDSLAPLSERGEKGRWTTPAMPVHLPLRAIYELAYDGRADVRIEQVPMGEAFVTVTRHSFAGALASEVGQGAAHLQACADLARTVPVYRLGRPRDLARLEAVVRAIEAHARSSRADPPPGV